MADIHPRTRRTRQSAVSPEYIQDGPQYIQDGPEYVQDEIVTSERTSVSSPYGIAQILCAALGVFFLVVGAIGLLRSGLGSLTEPSTTIMGMGATPLLSLIHVFIGIIALVSATSRSASRGAAMGVGASLIALGIIAIAEKVPELGWTNGNAAGYLIAGSLALASALLTPAYSVGEQRVSRGARQHIA